MTPVLATTHIGYASTAGGGNQVPVMNSQETARKAQEESKVHSFASSFKNAIANESQKLIKSLIYFMDR